MLNLKHIRQNPELYERTCIERNYGPLSGHAYRIVELHSKWLQLQQQARSLRQRSHRLQERIAEEACRNRDSDTQPDKRLTKISQAQLLDEAKQIKASLSSIEKAETEAVASMEALALELPNLTSDETPRGTEARVLSYINESPAAPTATQGRTHGRSHRQIGAELGILDFDGAATASGWGWYYLLGDAARLEQALVQYALAVAQKHGWQQVSPPSMVYSHIGAACGFQPRDQNGEQQVYALAQSSADAGRGVPPMCLAGTSEIPLAGMKAMTTMDAAHLPLKFVAVSRCYRAEAGGRGADTKGLFRVHEFTKVELFAWTTPDSGEADSIFSEIIDIQTEILSSLGLFCRTLSMPSADLGASAARKVDMEAFFPSRRNLSDGWGEVTSASICTDYQSRRLATRIRLAGSQLSFPWTVNGTALAVPRVLAALLENGWDEENRTVELPACLSPWMDGKSRIER